MKRLCRESYEPSDELVEELNSLLADEFLAYQTYKLATVAMRGNKQHRIEEVADENGTDELEDHFDNLSTWMQSKGIEVVTSHRDMERMTKCTKFDFHDGASTREVLDALIVSEEEAIDHYEEVLGRDDVKFDLATMLTGFLKDERDHLKHLVDIRDEMDGDRS